MKPVFSVATLITIAVILSGCAFHSGSFVSNIPVDKDGKPTYTVVDVAKGKASAFYVFGIGGNDRSTLIEDARKNMYLANPLSPGQVFGNVSVNIKRGFYFPVSITTITVTADIFQWGPTTNITQTQVIEPDTLTKEQIAYLSQEDKKIEIGKTPLKGKPVAGSYVTYVWRGDRYTAQVQQIQQKGTKAQAVRVKVNTIKNINPFVIPIKDLKVVGQPTNSTKPETYKKGDEVWVQFQGAELYGVIQKTGPDSVLVLATLSPDTQAKLTATYDRLRLLNPPIVEKIEYTVIQSARVDAKVKFFVDGQIKPGIIREAQGNRVKLIYLSNGQDFELWVPRNQVFEANR
ncbi:MAG: DUF6567 family protein [Bacteroidota bacterium]